MNKKVPQRMCIACREMKDKNDLLKIVKNKDGQIELDLTGKKAGRGAYICKSSECHKKLNKQKLLNRTFSMNVDAKIYEQIEEFYKIQN
ncbi:MAG: YlxR family protein [Clostridia bacterium]|nr:YlxR family protein [Clostridia bacterium]